MVRKNTLLTIVFIGFAQLLFAQQPNLDDGNNSLTCGLTAQGCPNNYPYCNEDIYCDTRKCCSDIDDCLNNNFPPASVDMWSFIKHTNPSYCAAVYSLGNIGGLPPGIPYLPGFHNDINGDGINDLHDPEEWASNVLQPGIVPIYAPINPMVDNIPAIGSVAWWDQTAPDFDGMVGIVVHIDTPTCTVDVATCNFGCGHAGEYATIYGVTPNAYIHFEMWAGQTPPPYNLRNNQISIDWASKPNFLTSPLVQYGVINDQLLIRNNGTHHFNHPVTLSIVLVSGATSFPIYEQSMVDLEPGETHIANITDYPLIEPLPGQYEVQVHITDANGIVHLANTYCDNIEYVTILDNLLAADAAPELLWPGTLCNPTVPVISTLLPQFRFRGVQNATSYDATITGLTGPAAGNTIAINNIPNNQPPIFNGPALLPLSTYQWTITAHYANGPDQSAQPFCFATPSYINLNCGVDDVSQADQELYDAVTFLCANNIIIPEPIPGGPNGYVMGVRPNDQLIKKDLAIFVGKAVWGNGLLVPGALVTDRYPIPFLDVLMSDPYTRFAKFLSFLFYDNDDDRETPFTDNYFNFRPYSKVTQNQALRAAIEAFNIDIPAPDTATLIAMATFGGSDVVRVGDVWFNAAYNQLNPSPIAKRRDLFIWLYRLMHAPNPAPDFQALTDADNFFAPGHYTIKTMAITPGLSDGNFDFALPPVFSIPNGTLPISFSAYYESEGAIVPDEYYKCLDFAQKGWTHNNCGYVHLLKGWTYNGYTLNDHLIVFFPGQTFPDVWQIPGNNLNGNLIPVTEGLTYTLRHTNGNLIVETLNKIRYQFSIIEPNVWGISQVKDLKNPSVYVDYAYVQHNGMNVLDEVCPSLNPGKCIKYHRGNVGQVTSVDGPAPGGGTRSVHFHYNNNDTKMTSYDDLPYDGQPVTTTFTYGSNFWDRFFLRSIQLPKGNQIDNTYSNRRLTSSHYIQNGQASMETSVQQDFNNVSGTFTNTVSQENNNQTTARVRSTRASNGYTTTTTIWRGNNPEYNIGYNYQQASYPGLPSSIDDNGMEVTTAFNNKGQMTDYRIPSMGIHKRNTYTQDYAPLTQAQQVDGVWQTTHFTYDQGSWGNLTSVTDAENGVTTISNYGNHGMPGNVESPTHIVSRAFYLSDGRLDYTMDALNHSWHVDYDQAFRRTSLTTPKQEIWGFEYWENDLPWKNVAPDASFTEAEYDLNKNMTQFHNSNGEATSYDYNFDTDMLESMEMPNNDYDEYDWNDDGTLDSYTDRNGHQFDYDYSDGRLETDGFFDYEYDTDGNVEQIEESANSDNRITYEYDDLERLDGYEISFQEPGGNTHHYEFNYDLNEVGNVTLITLPDQHEIINRFNKKNELVEVEDWLGNIYRIIRRADGSIQRVEYPNHTEKRIFYDVVGAVDSVCWVKIPSNQLITAYGFVRDPNSNPVVMPEVPAIQTGLLDEVDITFTHDANNRTTNATGLGAIQGNWTYDANGNQTENPRFTTVYDAINRPVEIHGLNGLPSGSYVYAPTGQRVYAERGNEKTIYWWDIAGMGNMMAEVDAVTGQPRYYYIYAGNMLMARINAQTNELSYYHDDYRGNVVAMTNSQAQITHSYSYLTYGQLAAAQEPPGDYNRFRFMGGMGVTEEMPNLYHARARFYDAEQMRFFGEDKVWGENLYIYSNNNSITSADPSGKFLINILAGATIGFGVNAIGQIIENKGFKNFDWGDAGIAAAEGAITAIVPGGKVIAKVARDFVIPVISEYGHVVMDNYNENGGNLIKALKVDANDAVTIGAGLLGNHFGEKFLGDPVNSAIRNIDFKTGMYLKRGNQWLGSRIGDTLIPKLRKTSLNIRNRFWDWID